MKYLKTYENSVLDTILDKISKNGMKSLTPSEDAYLKNVYKGDSKKLEDIVKKKKSRVSGVFDYDPRKDQMYFDEIGKETGMPFDFSKDTDEDIEEGRFDILWNDLDEEDIDHFVKYFDIQDAKKEYKGSEVYKDWLKLSKDTQTKFKKYINEIY